MLVRCKASSNSRYSSTIKRGKPTGATFSSQWARQAAPTARTKAPFAAAAVRADVLAGIAV